MVLPAEHEDRPTPFRQLLDGTAERLAQLRGVQCLIGPERLGPGGILRFGAAGRQAHPIHDTPMPEMIQRLVPAGGEQVGPDPGHRLPALPLLPDPEEDGLHQLLRRIAGADVAVREVAQRPVIALNNSSKTDSSPARMRSSCPGSGARPGEEGVSAAGESRRGCLSMGSMWRRPKNCDELRSHRNLRRRAAQPPVRACRVTPGLKRLDGG